MTITDIDDLAVLEEPVQHATESTVLDGFGINFHHLTTLKQAVARASVIDMKKVEQIKNELASGNYTISSEGIAAGMLSFI